MQRQRRLPAIVDYVLSGHRFKLLIPKETCGIAFSLSGVRCPGRGEPYSEEAIAFMRRRILQRDVEVRYGVVLQHCIGGEVCLGVEVELRMMGAWK